MGFFAPDHIPPPFKHQSETTEFILDNRLCFNASDPGTGKTRSTLDACAQIEGAALILAPKAILEPAWANDAKKFTPQLRVSVAYAKNRHQAFSTDADIYITNHDAASWLVKNVQLLKARNITFIGIDESTAFKHHTSQRSKALRQLFFALKPKYRVLMTGTPNINNLLDIWHQAYLLDEGLRLGGSFYKFRQSICTPTPGPFTQWIPKPDAAEAITELLDDLTIRYSLEECIDIPEHSTHVIPYDLSRPVRTAYNSLVKDCILEINNTEIDAINAAVLHTKLLQTASGSIYDAKRKHHVVHNDRYDLVAELIAERQHSVVGIQWQHEATGIAQQLDKRSISYAIIDGSTTDRQRTAIVNDFQAGKYQTILASHRAASHGLTLTRATSTIWPSPISDAERFLQFNRRIYRSGQTQRTETLVVVANDTIETATYARCTTRLADQQSILDMLKDNLAPCHSPTKSTNSSPSATKCAPSPKNSTPPKRATKTPSKQCSAA